MMKTLHKLLKFAAFVICCICVVTVSAQSGFVGDGFGGRSWYQPSNLEAGPNVAGAIVKGQLYLWGYKRNVDDPVIMPIPAGYLVKTDGSTITDPTWAGAAKPYPVAGFSNTKIVSLSATASAIKTDGSGWLWGPRKNSFPTLDGQVGSFTFGETPIQVLPAGQAYHTNASVSHVAFVKTDGTVWCAGWNINGCFGIGVIGCAGGVGSTPLSAYTSTLVQMKNITNAKRVVCAAYGFGSTINYATNGTLVLKGDGTVWVAGAANILQSGGTDYLPHQVTGLANVVDIKAGQDFAVALKSNGEVYCWGNRYYAPLGNGEIQGTTGYYYTPQKVLFPDGTPPIVAIETDPTSLHTYAIDEAGTLWGWGYQSGTIKFGVNTASAQYPVRCASYVADITDGGENRISYLTRNSYYPANQRLWYIGSNETYKISALAPTFLEPVTVNKTDTGYLSATGLTTWSPSDPTSAGLPNGIGTFDGDGTINCNKTQLTPAPVQGTASNLNLAVSLNVTTSGNFTPVISGSGMSLANPTYTISATTTGTQVFYIPLRYDGSALSTINLNFKEIATGCTITITGSKPAIVNIITNDCVPTAGPALK